MNLDNQACMDACNTCADQCDNCAVSCLSETNVKEMTRCIALDMDCAAICRLAAGFIARDSEFTKHICECCAKICDACAEECAKHQNDHCRQCAEACRQCAIACRSM